MAKKNKINYSMANHATESDVVLFSLRGTGIDLNNEQHKHFCDVLLKVVATQMFAHANGVKPENVKM